MQLHPVAQSKGELQEVHGSSCSPTQAHQDELAAVTDIPTLWRCSFHAKSSGHVFPSEQMVQLINLKLAAEHEKKQAIKAVWQDEVR